KSLIFILIFAAYAHWASGFITAGCSWSPGSGGSCTNYLTGKTVHFNQDPQHYFGMFVPSTTPSPWMLANPNALML
ncbi:hypothetical protein V3C99_009117, partial [Haemonchus contortus]